MEGLGRVNLLVGPNNCGKTSLLEAILLLASPLDPCLLGVRCLRRGAVSAPAGDGNLNAARIALRHLFCGHQIQAGSSFEVAGRWAGAPQQLFAHITKQPGPSTQAPTVPTEAWLTVRRSGPGPSTPAGQPAPSESESIPLTKSFEWPFSDWAERQRVSTVRPTMSLGTASASRNGVIAALSAIQLNPEEALVLDILRLIEPKLEGITAVPTPEIPGLAQDRGGVFVKLQGQRERVPIASLGEGTWRLLGLALALVDAKGSVLLVDEIDIGLHYSVQAQMWRMVKLAAEQLDVQVFATTHSRDCIHALAQLARADVTANSEVTIQRIEGERAIAYNEQEIVLAAERGIEVR